MHLQQTKRGSRSTGGPQYYFHKLTDAVSTYLRKKKVVPVALVTPYGATPTHFLAVSSDAKLSGSSFTAGRVGHDRIQMARAGQSIGEAIRDWYHLPQGFDFERIDVDISFHDDCFYLSPLSCKLVGKTKKVSIQKPEWPLSFHRHFESRLWRDQLRRIREKNRDDYAWAIGEIERVVSAHVPSKTAGVMEPDLLRAAGALSIFGMQLGAYLGRGFDCKESRFQFLDYQPYSIPVEVKKRSSGFQYQQRKYSKGELSRAVVLCAHHDLANAPPNIDVIELTAFRA